jgi:hypothetical protein
MILGSGRRGDRFAASRDKLLLLGGWYLAILDHHLYKYGGWNDEIRMTEK